MLHAFDDQTIIAQCTPRASGAIALLRISGIDAIAIAQSIAQFSTSKNLLHMPTHTIHYGSVRDDNGQLIDQVLFLLMKGPQTFTGQDTVEITCHNNQFIIDQIISTAIMRGARLAQEGEFTKRAVLNGKIDLVQAEAIKELIHAQTQMALKKSLSQLTGSFSQWIVTIENDLLKALALSEASFEFLDEELSFASQIATLISNVLLTIKSLKKTFNQQQQIRNGIRIAIIGTVNAGKSSLFNALIKQERAIVTPIAGTTRDVLEAGLYRDGNYWTLIDTAGLRQTDDYIEQEGIRRSRQQAQKADIIILASDASRSLTVQEEQIYQELIAEYNHKIIPVFTKADTITTPLDSCPACKMLHATPYVHHSMGCSAVLISSIRQYNIDLLEQRIAQQITQIFQGAESPFLLNERHYTLLLSLEHALEKILTMLTDQPAYELLSIHLQDAIAHVAQLSGKQISEAGMDMIFKEFCIGK